MTNSSMTNSGITNPAEHLRDILIEPAPNLFFSRNDSADVRMGDLVLRKMEGYVPEVKIGIVGVPEDEGVRRNKGRVGARRAPTEIRRALYKLTPLHPDQFPQNDIPALRIFDFGDIREGSTLEETHERLEYAVEIIMEQGIVPIVLGGGHDISYPNFCGMSRAVDRVGVLNVDAHLDFRPPVPERHSGTSFRLMLEDEHKKLLPANMVEFGIQPFANVAEHFEEMVNRGATVLTLDRVRANGCAQTFAEALHIASANVGRVMVSFDMDAVRSADSPGVSAPSPVGLFAEDMLQAAFLAGKHSLVQFIDIAEVNPEYDADGRTAKLAALVVMHFLSGFVQR
ncbi:MAG: formimidoylglutamase [Candidatus Kapabacteria bacterium]|nr:formimidoylglutamase [Candidatus Kapabacteria bacterium]